jgi:single-strand DNA-binding protein
MNCVNLIGRLTKDSELSFTAGSGVAVLKYSVAVDRDYKGKDGQKEADFINCIMFNKAAEGLAQYLTKGKLIGVTGAIRTGSYDAKDGTKRYTTDIVVSQVKFLDSKKSGENNQSSGNNEGLPEGMGEGITPVDGEDIPF